MVRFEHESSGSEPCCSTHCAMGTIGVSEKRQKNHKDISHDRNSNLDPLLEKFSF